MSKQRKHLTPLKWEEENSGEVRHPHREAKIIGEKKVGLEPMDQELNNKNLIDNDRKKSKTKLKKAKNK